MGIWGFYENILFFGEQYIFNKRFFQVICENNDRCKEFLYLAVLNGTSRFCNFYQ